MTEFTEFKGEELDKKIIDNIERMALNVGGNIRQMVRDGQYTYAVRELGNLIMDATMARYVCEQKVKEHGTYTPSAQKLEFGDGTTAAHCPMCDEVVTYRTDQGCTCPACGSKIA